jgi:transcriptional regulator with XRE-family HTH domain
MESPGKFLKKERERRNISLEEISNFTKIKEHYLKAIEEDKYELLPPALYIKGYLNGYARYLALDPKDIVLQYQNYLKSLEPPEPIEVQQRVPPPKNSVRPWFLVSLIFAFISLTGFFIFNPTRQPSGEKSKPILHSSVSPSPEIQQDMKAQRTFRAQQNEGSGLEKLEVRSSVPQYRYWGLIRVDPEQHSSASSLKAGLGAVEWVKDASAQQIPDFEVLEASIGTGIEREGSQHFLTGICSDFRSDNQRGYFFTKIKTPRAGRISHIWIWEGKEYHRMEMDVKPPAWSVYSYFTFGPQHTGNWKAEARDGDRVLTSLNFRVTQSSGDRSL